MKKIFSKLSFNFNAVAKVASYLLVAAIFFVAGTYATDISAYLKGNPTAADIDLSSLQELYDELRTNFDGDLSTEELLAGAKSGLVDAAGDPHTVFFTDKEAKKFFSNVNGTFTGIGARLGKKDNRLVIISPLEGSPAKAAGIRAGDIIAEVNGESTDGWSIEKAVDTIRGPALTTVKLSIVREGKFQEISITRDEITVPSVEHEIIDDNIGYIRIYRFAHETADEARKAAKELKSKNVDAIILDLRGNGGGYLSAARGLSSIWLEQGQTVVTERTGGQVTDTIKATGNPVLNGMPTMVLVDEGSASASEITAAALRDNDAAKLVGVQTYGKGSVQDAIELDDGGVLKVTIAHWFTPAGQSIAGDGLKPDEVVKLSEKQLQNKIDEQLEKAIDLLN